MEVLKQASTFYTHTFEMHAAIPKTLLCPPQWLNTYTKVIPAALHVKNISRAKWPIKSDFSLTTV